MSDVWVTLKSEFHFLFFLYFFSYSLFVAVCSKEIRKLEKNDDWNIRDERFQMENSKWRNRLFDLARNIFLSSIFYTVEMATSACNVI